MATYTFESHQSTSHIDMQGERVFALPERKPVPGMLRGFAKVALVLSLVAVGLVAFAVAVGLALVISIVLLLRARAGKVGARRRGRTFPDTVS